MIEDTGKVIRVERDKALVEVERSSACAQCGLQEVEDMAGGKPVFKALNRANAQVGDTVRVRVESVAYMKASAFIYGIPVLFLMAGAVFGFYLAGRFGASPDGMSAVLGMAGLVAGAVVVFLYRRKETGKEYLPVIVEIIREDVVDRGGSHG
jgi:sigma-E factor negative regulatory protein RseC